MAWQELARTLHLQLYRRQKPGALNIWRSVQSFPVSSLHGGLMSVSSRVFFQCLSLCRPQGKLPCLCIELVAGGSRTNKYLRYLFIFYAWLYCSREGENPGDGTPETLKSRLWCCSVGFWFPNWEFIKCFKKFLRREQILITTPRQGEISAQGQCGAFFINSHVHEKQNLVFPFILPTLLQILWPKAREQNISFTW